MEGGDDRGTPSGVAFPASLAPLLWGFLKFSIGSSPRIPGPRSLYFEIINFFEAQHFSPMRDGQQGNQWESPLTFSLVQVFGFNLDRD